MSVIRKPFPQVARSRQVGNEAFQVREKRLERQKDFLHQRKLRHDAALEAFRIATEQLSSECQTEVWGATERVKADLEEPMTGQWVLQGVYILYHLFPEKT